MNKQVLQFLLVFFPFFLLSQTTPKVLLIGVDGCRPDALAKAATPNLDDLISKGLYSPDALNSDITISGPGWSAILCGVWSEKHGVLNNDFSSNNYINYPSIYKYIEGYNSTLHTASFCHWNPINDQIIGDDADFKLNLDSDAEVASQASSYLAINNPDLLFLHFDEADQTGHAFGFSPDVPEYISTIESIDTQIGQVLDAIEARSSYPSEDWLIIVTTDHGGLGRNHGGNSLEEQNVFMIVSGEQVNQELILRDSTLLGGPENCLGDSAELYFDGNGDYVQVLDNALFDFGDDRDFTVECRVKTTQAADVAIVGNKDWVSGSNKGFVFSFKFSSGPEWKVNIGDGNNRTDINIGGPIADNEWHTLSVSFDRDGLMSMYEDGVFVAAEDISSIGDINTSAGLYFGSDINGTFSYQGAIADVRVWDGVLNETIISDWYCKSIDSNHPNFQDLLGYWPMNEGTGNVEVVDLSSNSNSGIINEATWRREDSVKVYNYDHTPRLTDAAVTALTHLCIPIQASWDLDGSSLIAECMLTSNVTEKNKSTDILVYPNPMETQIMIERKTSGKMMKVALFQADGKKILDNQTLEDKMTLDVSDLIKGLYFLKIEYSEGFLYKKLVKLK